MSNDRDIPIVAIGACTPVGFSAATTAAAVRAGISRVAEHPFMVDGRGDAVRAAMGLRLDPALSGWQRMAGLAAAALAEVGEQVGHEIVRAGVVVALPEPRPGFSEAEESALMSALTDIRELRGTPFMLGGRGHAGALQSIAEALEQLRSGSREVLTILGVDSYIDPDTIDWLQVNKQLAGEDVRSGMFPGEAAAAVVLASAGSRRRGNLPVVAWIGGAHVARETKLIKTGAGVLGEGLFAAIAGATEHLRLPQEAIDMTWCDFNGERYRVAEWAFAVLRARPFSKTQQYQMAASSVGDVGAAHGALACVLAARAWARQYAAGPRALVLGSSEGGLRAAAVLLAPGVG